MYASIYVGWLCFFFFLLSRDPPSRNSEDDDVRFMREAQKLRSESEDKQTTVGAVIVHPVSKKILGEGWNRKPLGCEDRFYGTVDNEPFNRQGKQYYGKHKFRIPVGTDNRLHNLMKIPGDDPYTFQRVLIEYMCLWFVGEGG